MSTRERWIVYPLLFLALGLALRDKVLPRTRPLRAATVEVDRLVVHELLAATAVDALRVQCRGLAVTAPDGRPQVQLLTTPRGGMVRAIDRDGRLLLTLGHLEATSGVTAMRPEGEPLLLTPRLRLPGGAPDPGGGTAP